MPVEFQLAVFLYCAGHFGNSTSIASIVQWAGMSEGAVVKCICHIQHSFMALHDDAIHPPTDEQLADAKAWVGSQSCDAWHHGYSMVDGTLVPLSDKPGFHGEAYYDQKTTTPSTYRYFFWGIGDL